MAKETQSEMRLIEITAPGRPIDSEQLVLWRCDAQLPTVLYPAEATGKIPDEDPQGILCPAFAFQRTGADVYRIQPLPKAQGSDKRTFWIHSLARR
jgi:hypothetical protein